MYTKYAETQKWKTSLVSASESDSGGYKEATIEVKGDSVYSKLKVISKLTIMLRIALFLSGDECCVRL